MNRSADDERAFKDWKDDALKVSLTQVAGTWKFGLKKKGVELIGPCPRHGGKDRFSIHPGKGKWNCRGSEGGASPVGMLMHVTDLSYMEAIEKLSGRPPPKGQAKPLTDEELEERRRRDAEFAAEQQRKQEDLEQERELKAEEAAEIFHRHSVPMGGTLAEVYMIGRGVPVPPMGWDDNTRFCPDLFHKFDRRRHPAMVSGLRDVTDDVVAIQGVFLNPKTAKKIDTEEAKLTYGPAHGAAVRLGAAGPIGNPCEGVETGYAIRWLIDHREPVYCTLGTSGLINFEPPLEINALRGWTDGDKPIQKKNGIWVPRDVPAGREAMNRLRARVVPAGIEWLKTEEPPPGRDWLNIFNTLQKHFARESETA